VSPTYRSQTLSDQVSRHVVRDPEAFRQEPTIVGTKVLVRDIVEVWRSGVAPEVIPERLFNLVSVAQVFDAIGFYLDNQAEIDEQIQWYRNHPPLNLPMKLRLNPLRDEVTKDSERIRQIEEQRE
jgi:uncharacterized protein (DUF433 family)